MLFCKAGASLLAAGALGVSFGVTSASYTMASGTAELVCLLDEREDLAAKIPSGYLNATVGLVVEEVNGNTKSTKIIKCALSITEGVMTLSILKIQDRSAIFRSEIS